MSVQPKTLQRDFLVVQQLRLHYEAQAHSLVWEDPACGIGQPKN